MTHSCFLIKTTAKKVSRAKDTGGSFRRRPEIQAGNNAPPQGLILQQKWEVLAQYIFKTVLRDLPKSERFTLGADIRQVIWQVEEALIQLSLRYGNRTQLLNFVDMKAKLLLTMIRLGIQMEIVPQRRYEQVSAMLVEIGRIVGGLKKFRQ